MKRYDNNGQNQRVRQQGADLLVGMTQAQLPPRRDGPRRAAGVGKTIEDLRRRAVAQEQLSLQRHGDRRPQVGAAGGPEASGPASHFASYDKRFSYAAAAATRAAQFPPHSLGFTPRTVSRVPLLRTAPEMGLMDAEGS